MHVIHLFIINTSILHHDYYRIDNPLTHYFFGSFQGSEMIKKPEEYKKHLIFSFLFLHFCLLFFSRDVF